LKHRRLFAIKRIRGCSLFAEEHYSVAHVKRREKQAEPGNGRKTCGMKNMQNMKNEEMLLVMFFISSSFFPILGTVPLWNRILLNAKY
jgi:hypothetical protein